MNFAKSACLSQKSLVAPASAPAAVEQLETRVHLTATGYEPLNGAGNNVANPAWGATGTDLIRLAAAGYTDGISSPSLAGNQSGRAISNSVNSQTDPNNPSQQLNTQDANRLSDFGYAFGQFIDHDLSLTPDGGASLPIAVAANDPIGTSSLPFTRSQYDPATGTSTANPRQQVTDVTAYLDLSQVYGSDAATAADLRTMQGGLLKTSPGNMLPYFNSTYFTAAQLASLNGALGGLQNNGPLPLSSLFATGDIRGNENLELTALETLFVRNHNLLAGKLQQEHPRWTDEQLYQEARKINIAGYQAMIYNQYLPALLGNNALPNYTGYNPAINAAISNEFSTVAFRMGHSMVSPTIARDGNNGQPVASEVSLAQDFFDPNLLNPTGAVDPMTGLKSTDIGPVLKAEADGNGQAMDAMAIDEVRNLLFGNGAGGEDLIARDIQRGRDNGIPDYNSLRKAMGLQPVTSFAQITSNIKVQQELAAAYPGGVNTIDAFEGGVAEDHVPGSDLGPLFQSILVDQFSRLRTGDRFYFQNQQFTRDERELLWRSDTLTNVIEANSTARNLQPNAFIFGIGISGRVHIANHCPAVGQTVTLINESTGSVVGTTLTDASGRYQFDQYNGLSLGSFQVSTTLPNGSSNTTVDSRTLTFTRGDIYWTRVNLGDRTLPPTSAPDGWLQATDAGGQDDQQGLLNADWLHPESLLQSVLHG